MELAKVYDELYGMIEDLRKQIGSGGGGGGIEINPEGAATDDLEKIKKGSAIYGLNYNKNANRPQVNGNLLTGNKNSKQLNIAEEMSEAAYAALSSKNENEIYFLTENAPVFTETDTVASSGITWIAGVDPDTYTATLSYSVVDTDTTGVVGVTCDNDLITIGDPTYEAGSVSVPMICEDPTAITGDIEFVYTLMRPVGSTRIVKNGVRFGGAKYTKLWDYKTDNNNSVLYGATLSATLHDTAENYDALILNLMCISSDESDANWKGSAQCHVDMHALAESFQAGHFIYQSNSDRASHFYINGTTLQKISQAPAQTAATTNGLVNVIGIKY